jgi:glycine cleavage system aminomethyltransferase T
MASDPLSTVFHPSSPLYQGATLLYPFAPGVLLPYEYDGLRVEAAAARTTAWIGTMLMISPIYDVTGPDAVEFLNSVCTNDFSKLSLKGLRHAVLCNDKGQIMTDGVVIKLGENHFRTYWLNPPIEFLLKKSELRVEGTDQSLTEYFIQIAGEKSLEILENVCECDLHDIKFAGHRTVSVNGKPMRVIRLGMSGNLAYEVHGAIGEFEDIYKRICSVGERFGARKLGMNAYSGPNHTVGGYPNIHIHYPLPWFESEHGRYQGLSAYLAQNPHMAWFNLNRRLTGSAGNQLEERFVTPYDVGWGNLVKLEKSCDFPGKKALTDLAQTHRRTLVSLEWNASDVASIYASQLMGPGTEPCEPIDMQLDMYYQANAVALSKGEGVIYRADRVLAGDEPVGISTGRVIDYHYNRMVSLAFIDKTQAKIGSELSVLWGTPGTPQRNVRVKVAKVPYHDSVRNEDRDVSDVPKWTTQALPTS